MRHFVLGTRAGAGSLVLQSLAEGLFLCPLWPFKGLSPNRLLDANLGAVVARFSRVFKTWQHCSGLEEDLRVNLGE